MKRLFLYTLVFLVMAFGPSDITAETLAANSNQRPVLVELFTAQGCVNCPEANRFLGELSKDPGLITLSLAVDYWDYLGWADTYAMSDFSKRQKEYGEAVHSRRPFTPQIIIDGKASVRATRPEKVRRIIRDIAKEQAAGPKMSMVRDGKQIRLDIAAGDAPKGGAVIFIADYIPGTETVNVKSGENRGKTLEQVNMVTRLRKIGHWNGEAMSLELPLMQTGSCVAILQEPGPSKVLAVTRLAD